MVLSNCHDPTAGISLSKRTNRQELTVSFVSTRRVGVVAPHPAVLQSISTLLELRNLTVYLSSPTQLTIFALSAVVSMKNLTSLCTSPVMFWDERDVNGIDLEERSTSGDFNRQFRDENDL